MKYLSNLVQMIDELYSQYGDTKHELYDTAMFFAERGQLAEYIIYLKRHFNNAFSDIEDVIEAVDAMIIAKMLSGEAKEVLWQCVGAPKFDGDVISKSGKSELYSANLIIRIANNWGFGDNAATSLGWKVYKELRDTGYYDSYPSK